MGGRDARDAGRSETSKGSRARDVQPLGRALTHIKNAAESVWEGHPWMNPIRVALPPRRMPRWVTNLPLRELPLADYPTKPEDLGTEVGPSRPARLRDPVRQEHTICGVQSIHQECAPSHPYRRLSANVTEAVDIWSRDRHEVLDDVRIEAQEPCGERASSAGAVPGCRRWVGADHQKNLHDHHLGAGVNDSDGETRQSA